MKPFRFIRRFLHNEQGSVLLLAGVSFLVLVGVSGAAVDLGRQQLLRAKLQQATDAAAIAVATMDSTMSTPDKRAVGRRYFMLNFPEEYMGMGRPSVNVAVGDEIEVTAQVNMPTRFVRYVGVNSVRSRGYTRMSSETTSTGGSSYDIILSMDVSGSMACATSMLCPNFSNPTREAALRQAANSISQNLLQNNTTNSRIAANTWDNTVRAAIPFQDNYAPMQNFINANVGSYLGTCSAEGMERAQEQAANFRADVVRAVVLLTDGVNNANCNAPTLTICNQFKNQGVIVYTIALGADVTIGPNAPAVRTFLSSCASGTANANEGQYFFIAPDAATLQTVFQSILTSVKTMRILD